MKIIRRGKKNEYMKYEDGRIVSVGYKQEKNNDNIDKEAIAAQEETTTPQKKIADVVANAKMSLKQWLLSKWTRWIIVAIFFLFFIFTLWNIFQVLNAKQKTSNQTTVTTTRTSSVVAIIPKKQTQSTSSIASQSQKKEDITKMIAVSNEVNNKIVFDDNQEIAWMNQYFSNQLNLELFYQNVSGTLSDKQSILQILNNQQSLFEETRSIGYFNATRNRVLNSITFSNTLLSDLDSVITNQQMQSQLSIFLKDEKMWKSQQNKNFIQFLQNEKIPYQIMGAKHLITYSIPS